MNLARNTIKGSLIALTFAPSYIFYMQSVAIKPVVDIRLQHLMFKDPVLALRHGFGFLKPLALAGALGGATYTLFYRYWWESLGIKNNFIKLSFGHGLFGGIMISMFMPNKFWNGVFVGFMYGWIKRTLTLFVGDPETAEFCGGNPICAD